MEIDKAVPGIGCRYSPGLSRVESWDLAGKKAVTEMRIEIINKRIIYKQII
jgi:hypothetical protein